MSVSRKVLRLLLSGSGGPAGLQHLELGVHGSPEWWNSGCECHMLLFLYLTALVLPVLRQLSCCPGLGCSLTSSLSLSWVLWDSNLMWNRPKMDIWNVTDLEARMRMRRSNILSVFFLKKKLRVRQRQYLKRNGGKNFQDIWILIPKKLNKPNQNKWKQILRFAHLFILYRDLSFILHKALALGIVF